MVRILFSLILVLRACYFPIFLLLLCCHECKTCRLHWVHHFWRCLRNILHWRALVFLFPISCLQKVPHNTPTRNYQCLSNFHSDNCSQNWQFHHWILCLCHESYPFSIHLNRRFFHWDSITYQIHSSCYHANDRDTYYHRYKRMFLIHFVYHFLSLQCIWFLKDKWYSIFSFSHVEGFRHFLTQNGTIATIMSIDDHLGWEFSFSFQASQIRKIMSFSFVSLLCWGDRVLHNLMIVFWFFIYEELMSLFLFLKKLRWLLLWS